MNDNCEKWYTDINSMVSGIVDHMTNVSEALQDTIPYWSGVNPVAVDIVSTFAMVLEDMKRELLDKLEKL